MVERKIKEAPVDGHEQTLATQSAKAANRSFRAHFGPEARRAANDGAVSAATSPRPTPDGRFGLSMLID